MLPPLIGAVTHVLVNDPATGYGIFIENMLDAAALRAIADRPYEQDQCTL